jgi:hypothetical protein
MNEEAIELYRAYLRVFTTDDGQRVLKDLERYCCVGKSILCTDLESRVDPYAMVMWEGSRRVFLHIQDKMKEPLVCNEDVDTLDEE